MDNAAEQKPQSEIETYPLKPYHAPKLQIFGHLQELTLGGPYPEDDIFDFPENGGGCGSCGGGSACV